MHCLFGAQAVSEQKKALKPVANPDEVRKIIFATNIAETSLTIPNIGVVIDSGLMKQQEYNENSKTIQLKIQMISRAHAIQRAGRTGRTRNGKCFRLYSKFTYDTVMNEHIKPEIQRAELRSFLVFCMKMGLDVFSSDLFLEYPSDFSIQTALDQLITIGVIRFKISEEKF